MGGKDDRLARPARLAAPAALNFGDVLGPRIRIEQVGDPPS
jgi:hypothetical protein